MSPSPSISHTLLRQAGVLVFTFVSPIPSLVPRSYGVEAIPASGQSLKGLVLGWHHSSPDFAHTVGCHGGNTRIAAQSLCLLDPLILNGCVMWRKSLPWVKLQNLCEKWCYYYLFFSVTDLLWIIIWVFWKYFANCKLPYKNFSVKSDQLRMELSKENSDKKFICLCVLLMQGWSSRLSQRLEASH